MTEPLSRRETAPPPSVAIVGAGFSGSLLAVHLVRQARAPLRVILVERRGRPGRGVAYGTRHSSHLLNVRTAGMSAFPEDPDHFVRWSRESGGLPDSAPTDFLPRQLYGRYVESLLAEAGSRPGPAALEVVRDEVVDLRETPGSVRLTFTGGRTVDVQRAALALGNLPGRGPLHELGDARYVEDPWAKSAFDDLPADAPVLILGTGLTMVDLLLALEDRGHRGRVHAVSRRGLLPTAHAPGRATPPVAIRPESVPPRIAAWLRFLRRRAADHPDWRPVLDGIRPHASAIWRGLPSAERERFLRHARPYWEVHRHRLAPPVAALLERTLREGRLLVHAARVQPGPPNPRGVEVRLLPRGGGPAVGLTVARIFNATGPEGDLTRLEDPLVRSLIEHGTIRPDAHRLGLDATSDGAVIDRDGGASRVLFALGPLLRGILWECTAVPEVRVQARDLARRWLDDLLAGR